MKLFHDKQALRMLITLIVLSLVVAFVINGIVTLAEYTKSSRAKRVVASYGREGLLFSSNYLIQNNGSPTEVRNRRRLFTGNAENSVVAEVTFCNYAQGNPGKVCQQDLPYTLTAKLIMVSGNTKRDATIADSEAIGDKTVTIVLNGETKTLSVAALTQTFSTFTLPRNLASTDIATVTFSPSFNDDESGICVYLQAVPDSSVLDVATIDGIFITSVAMESQSVAWEGYFNEAGARGVQNAALPEGFDGFNYTIEGFGVGTFKLSWRPDALVPNQLFISDVSASVQTETVQGATWNYVTFSVDSGTVSRYDLQFYYADGTTASYATWDDVKSYVTYVYTELIPEGND